MVALGYVLSLGYGVLCLLFAFLLSRLGVDKKITRKIVHIFIGFEWVILYHFHGASYHFLVVCLAFLALLIVAYKKKLLRMIASDSENAPGTVYYAVSMSIMAFVSMLEPRFILPFGVAVFATSLGDGFAGLLGQYVKCFNPKIYKEKTLVGTLSNAILSTLVAFVFMHLYAEMALTPVSCIAIGLVAAGVELVCGFGLDNIALPLSVSTLVYVFLIYKDVIYYILPIVLTPYIIAFVLKKHALTRSGLVAAIVLDLAITVALRNFGFILLVIFLIIGILTDKLKKKDNNVKEEKGACRDAAQVLANGLVPIIAALLYFILDERIYFFAFIASLSEALGDTAASSLGSYSKKTFDLFKFRKCERGMSGGVSLVGTLAALVFSAIIPLFAFAFNRVSPVEMLLLTVIAFLGVLFDSLLGSLLQAKYRCEICKSVTEKREHCGASTRLTSGVGFIRNDAVNALSTLFAAILAMLFFSK